MSATDYLNNAQAWLAQQSQRTMGDSAPQPNA